jgi:hypothetical protein
MTIDLPPDVWRDVRSALRGSRARAMDRARRQRSGREPGDCAISERQARNLRAAVDAIDEEIGREE